MPRRLSEIIKMMDSQGDSGIQASTAGSTANAIVSVAGYDQAAVQLDGGGSTYAATVDFEATVNGSDWVAVLAMNPNDGSIATQVTNDTGIHVINVSGFSGLRLNVSAYTSGNVTGSVRRVVGGGGINIADIEVSGAGGDSNNNVWALDTDGTYSAIQMDSADGALIVRQTGDTVQADAAAINPTLLPAELAFMYGLDTDGTWDRIGMDSGTAGLNVAVVAGAAGGDSDVVAYGLDDSGAEAAFHTLRGDSDQLAFADSDASETLSVIAIPVGLDTDGTYQRIGMDSGLEALEVHLAGAGSDNLFGLFGLDTDGTYSAIQMDSGDGSINVNISTGNLAAIRLDDTDRLVVMEDWNSTLQSLEATTTLNDASFSVTADKDWHVMWIWVEYTSGATAGTRQLQIDVRDSADDVIMSLIPGVTQAEGLTYYYLFAPGMMDLTAVRDTDHIVTPMPPSLIIPELFDIRIHDKLDFQAATDEDEMVIQMMVMDRGRVDT